MMGARERSIADRRLHVTKELTQHSDQAELDVVAAPEAEEIPLRRDKLVVKSGLKAGSTVSDKVCCPDSSCGG
jgi:6,7-dimethyl-8-ribityllumazine synthase